MTTIDPEYAVGEATALAGGPGGAYDEARILHALDVQTWQLWAVIGLLQRIDATLTDQP